MFVDYEALRFEDKFETPETLYNVVRNRPIVFHFWKNVIHVGQVENEVNVGGIYMCIWPLIPRVNKHI